MKILITGMSSSHCKKPNNLSFLALLGEALSEYGEIYWMSPSISWKKEDLEKYDLIIFGFSPPTSLSANKLYGALNVLGLMFDSPKLKLIVDSPQIWQYKNSINAVVKNPSILFGNFYLKRENYSLAVENPSLIEKAIAHMMVSDWPKIIYPSLPWNSDEKIASILGFGDPDKVLGINFDYNFVKPEMPRIGRKDYWAVENAKSTWVQTLAGSVSFPLEPTKIGKKTNETYAIETIKNSVGLILPPQDRNYLTWWNYRIIQALNTSTPIVTYWPDTKNFSSSWSLLAYQVEDMSPAQRQQLAAAQRGVYLESLPSEDELSNIIQKTLIGS